MRKLMNLEGTVVSTPKIYGKAAVHTVVIIGGYAAICFLSSWIPTFIESYNEEHARLQELKK